MLSPGSGRQINDSAMFLRFSKPPALFLFRFFTEQKTFKTFIRVHRKFIRGPNSIPHTPKDFSGNGFLEYLTANFA